MKITTEIKRKLRKNYEQLDFLEAIHAFYQIKGLVTESSSSSSPHHAEEALYQLHRIFMEILQEDQKIKGSELRKIQRLINVIEADSMRISSHVNVLLDTVHKVRDLFFGAEAGNFLRANRNLPPSVTLDCLTANE